LRDQDFGSGLPLTLTPAKRLNIEYATLEDFDRVVQALKK